MEGNLRGLSWAAERQVDLCTCPLNLTCLYRGFNCVESCIQFRKSQYHVSLSRLYLWGSFWEWGTQVEAHSKNRGLGVRGETSSCPGQAQESNQHSHLLDDFPQQLLFHSTSFGLLNLFQLCSTPGIQQWKGRKPHPIHSTQYHI